MCCRSAGCTLAVVLPVPFCLPSPAPLACPSLQASGSVRRNLGSALERAESSGASRPADVASRGPSAEVQSRLNAASVGPGAAAAATLAAPALSRGNGAAPAPTAAAAAAAAPSIEVPATPLDVSPLELQSPDLFSTGPQSSFSAAGDPAVPFTVPASTTRRFAQRDDANAASRRWAWRREGGGASRQAAGGLSVFQRARIASAGKQDSAPAADASTMSAAGVEHSEPSAASSAGLSSSADVSVRRATSEDHSRQQQQQQQQQQQAEGPAAVSSLTLQDPAAAAAAAGGGLPAGSAFAAVAFQPSPTGMRRSSIEAALATAAAARQRSVMAGSSLLRVATSLLDCAALPSPVDQLGAAAGYPPNAQLIVVEGLMRELRNMAALEVGGRAGGGRVRIGGPPGLIVRPPLQPRPLSVCACSASALCWHMYTAHPLLALLPACLPACPAVIGLPGWRAQGICRRRRRPAAARPRPPPGAYHHQPGASGGASLWAAGHPRHPGHCRGSLW